MKTEEEIKKRILQIQTNKSNAKAREADEAYVVNCKIEKALKWVLEE